MLVPVWRLRPPILWGRKIVNMICSMYYHHTVTRTEILSASDFVLFFPLLLLFSTMMKQIRIIRTRQPINYVPSIKIWSFIQSHSQWFVRYVSVVTILSHHTHTHPISPLIASTLIKPFSTISFISLPSEFIAVIPNLFVYNWRRRRRP